ncbi:MAG TPA: hypothetical protein DHW63_03145 [Hyphomonadaceae bacterium]|nr:hypothetical protein [Hyphomonadaceae bacterium]
MKRPAFQANRNQFQSFCRKSPGDPIAVAVRRTSLRSQLTSLVVIAVFGAVALATASYVWREVSQYGDQRTRELQLSATVFSATISNAVASGDQRSAYEALRAIDRMPSLNHVRVERADGSVTQLGATGKAELEAGDVFVIETPGGGGFGEA